MLAFEADFPIGCEVCIIDGAWIACINLKYHIVNLDLSTEN